MLTQHDHDPISLTARGAGRPAGVPLITVVICTRNRARLMERAVGSVLPQLDETTQIMIVDNASTDETALVSGKLAAAHPAVKALREDELGLSAARNFALQHARSEYVLFLDDDALADPGWLRAYRQFLSRPPSQRLAVAGSVVIPDYEVTPPGWFPTGQLNKGSQSKRVSAGDGPWGGNSAFHREAALQVGGFDRQLGRKGDSLAAFEEVELMRRLEAAGFEIWWLPDARILHFTPADRLRFGWNCRAALADGRSRALLYLRQRGERAGWPALGRVLVAPAHGLLNLLAALGLLICGRVQRATGSLFVALRIAGFGYQLAAERCGMIRPKL